MQVKSIGVAAMMVALVGCADHSQDYVKQSNSVPPVVPTADAKLKTGQNYYIVPGDVDAKGSQAPSLVPPGSQLQSDSEKKTKAAVNAAQWSESKSGQQFLVFAEKGDVAWKRVASALKKTPYRTLDKDRSMNSYYILDPKSTNNKITKKTPIYRLYLKPAANSTQIFLLDQHNHSPKLSEIKRVLGALQRELN